MDLIKAIQERRSLRAFKPDPIPRETIERLLDLVIRAPSAINLQPWDFVVVLGEERERLSRRLLKAYRERRVSCAPDSVKPLPRSIAKRGAKTLEAMNPFFKEMAVEPDRFINEGSCQFYGAPVAVLICLDDSFSKSRYVDIGIALAYFILIAHDMGLATCPIGLISAYEDEIKEELNLPHTKRVVIGVALGLPDPDCPINRFRSQRDPLESFVRWIE